MRSTFLLLIACLFLAACASESENIAETGISRARAIGIATVACKEYPQRYSVADRARWVRAGGYWVVEITDNYREQGRFYMIDRQGKIIGKGPIPNETPEPVYRGRRVYEPDRPYYDEGARPYRPYYNDVPYNYQTW
jgi:hypothetical protein